MKRRLTLLLALLALLAGGALAAQEDAQPALSARGYVLVTAQDQTGWLALPEEGDLVYPIAQRSPDGTEALNVLHLTPEGVYVEDASCENHDCMGQGIVTLENRDSRILGNMIVCLPNQVLVELFTPGEVQEMVRQGMPAPEK